MYSSVVILSNSRQQSTQYRQKADLKFKHRASTLKRLFYKSKTKAIGKSCCSLIGENLCDFSSKALNVVCHIFIRLFLFALQFSNLQNVVLGIQIEKYKKQVFCDWNDMFTKERRINVN